MDCLGDNKQIQLEEFRKAEFIEKGVRPPMGADPALKNEAAEQVRLSGLTLPHAMVRVMLAEALYRASSVIRGHPYHRE